MQTTSILLSIKKLLGIPSEADAFDSDIIMHINTVLANLVQMGVGPSDGFTIEGESANWSDFVGDTKKIEQIKSYVYLKVRMLFDPPQSSVLMDSMNKQASELEWRMYIEKDGH